MHGKCMANATRAPVHDASVWREEWFGPSAARWATQPANKSKNGKVCAEKACARAWARAIVQETKTERARAAEIETESAMGWLRSVGSIKL